MTPRQSRMTKQIKFRLDDATLQMINEISEKLSLTKSAAIRLLILQGYKRVKHRLEEYREEW